MAAHTALTRAEARSTWKPRCAICGYPVKTGCLTVTTCFMGPWDKNKKSTWQSCGHHNFTEEHQPSTKFCWCRACFETRRIERAEHYMLQAEDDEEAASWAEKMRPRYV